MNKQPRPEARDARFSHHALLRMVERKLSERICRLAIEQGDEIIEDSDGQVRRYVLQLSRSGLEVDAGLHVILDGLLVVTAYVRINN